MIFFKIPKGGTFGRVIFDLTCLFWLVIYG